MEDSYIVFKVTFGDTIRRFNVDVDGEDENLNLDILSLRAKIRSLFDLKSTDVFKLTYVDEDGDNIALVEEEDLKDLIRQYLDPVRVSVHLTAIFVADLAKSVKRMLDSQRKNVIDDMKTNLDSAAVKMRVIEQLCPMENVGYCDACGAVTTSRPRFTSIVEKDHEICSCCFGCVDNPFEYIGVYLSAPYQDPCLCNNNQPNPDRWVITNHVMHGTRMAGKSSFTVTWTMRNNGNVPWSRGTKLVWVSGDQFSDAYSVEVEVPVDGVCPGYEVDITVGFYTPEIYGDYTSYWKLESPAGEMFGSCVWLFLQVYDPFKYDMGYSGSPLTCEDGVKKNISEEKPSLNVEDDLMVRNSGSPLTCEDGVKKKDGVKKNISYEKPALNVEDYLMVRTPIASSNEAAIDPPYRQHNSPWMSPDLFAFCIPLFYVIMRVYFSFLN